jgi:hypothetical protein
MPRVPEEVPGFDHEYQRRVADLLPGMRARGMKAEKLNIRLEASDFARTIGRLWENSRLPGYVAEREAEKMLRDILRRAKREWQASAGRKSGAK